MSSSLQSTIEAARIGGLDFTAYRHPCLAVACPDCRARSGAWCRRPSGHKAMDLHSSRKQAADAAWEEAGLPTISQVGPEKYVYDEPAAPVQQPTEGDTGMRSNAKTKAVPAEKAAPAAKTKATPSTERRKREATVKTEKKQSKADVADRLLSSKNGATRKQLSDATGWPHVNLRTAGDRVEKIVVTKDDRFRIVAKGVDLEQAHADGWKNVF